MPEAALEGRSEQEEKEEESEAQGLEERIYTIPLKWAWVSSGYSRTPKAIKLIKKFALRHMKCSEVKLDPKLNEFLWRRGIERPPRHIRVRIVKEDETTAKLYLAQREAP